MLTLPENIFPANWKNLRNQSKNHALNIKNIEAIEAIETERQYLKPARESVLLFQPMARKSIKYDTTGLKLPIE